MKTLQSVRTHDTLNYCLQSSCGKARRAFVVLLGNKSYVLAHHLARGEIPLAKQPGHMINMRLGDSGTINCHPVVNQF